MYRSNILRASLPKSAYDPVREIVPLCYCYCLWAKRCFGGKIKVFIDLCVYGTIAGFCPALEASSVDWNKLWLRLAHRYGKRRHGFGIVMHCFRKEGLLCVPGEKEVAAFETWWKLAGGCSLSSNERLISRERTRLLSLLLNVVGSAS